MILELKIEKLIFEGVGLSHYEGKAVFVKNAVTGDIVKAKVVSKNKNYLRAEIVEIIEPSLYRIKPVCPLSTPCGGCDLAFIDYKYQLIIKEEIIKEIFKNKNVLPIMGSPDNIHYRAKTQFPVSETKNSKRLLIGYYKENSHEIVNIKYCPVHPEIFDKISEFTRKNWKMGGYIEKTDMGLLKNLTLRFSYSTGKILVMLVLNAKEITKEIETFASGLMTEFPMVKGVLANFNQDKTNKITGTKTVLIKGEDFIYETLKDKKYKIGANSFFQINPKSAELLFDEAKKGIQTKGPLLDLYGGAGVIGIYLKDCATKITLVEENKESIKLAKENFKLNNVLKYEVFEGDVKKTISAFKKNFANIIIDPPRKGSGKETLEIASRLTNSIIYISCNPMTLKRDSEILEKLGFNIEFIRPVDMFPNTHHIECIASFKGAE